MKEFKARIEIDDKGNKHLVIEPHTEIITRADGKQDVIINVPSLGLINNFKKENGINV